MKTTDGWWMAAIANIVLTNFSHPLTHLLARVEAEIDINVDFDWAEIALASNVCQYLSPKNLTPLGGALIPLKMPGRNIGQMIISFMIFFAFSSPAMSSHFTLEFLSIISFSMNSTVWGSKFLYRSSSMIAAKLFRVSCLFSFLLLSLKDAAWLNDQDWTHHH